MSNISLSKAVRANLMSLQSTAAMMSTTQERLATGNKVNSALDNPSNFFTATALNSRAGDMNNLLDSMASGIKTIEAANNGLTAITKTVESMQSTLRQARQDKSFNSATFDVTKDTVLNVAGGQLTAPANGIELTPSSLGEKAQVVSTSYTGAAPATVNEGRGARALLTVDASTAGDVLSIDGKSITLAAGSNAADITTKLGTSASAYTITDGNGANGAVAGQVIIEAKDPTSAAPSVLFVSGNTAATKGTTSFNFANVTGAGITVGGQAVAGGTFDQFVTNLQNSATAGGYTVNADATTKQITLTNAAYGNASPVISAGLPANAASVSALAASATFDVTLATATSVTVDGNVVALDGAGSATNAAFQIDLTGAAARSFTIGGQTVTIAATTGTAATDATNAQTAINTALGAIAAGPDSGFTAAVDAAGNVTLTAGVVGPAGSVNGTTVPTIADPFFTGVTLTPTTVTNGVAAETNATIQTKINAALTTAGSNFQVTVGAPAAGVSALTITATVAGTPAGAASAPAVTGVGVSAATSSTNGIASALAITTGYDSVAGSASGAHVETVAAATDDITVTYGGVSAAIKIGASAAAGGTPSASELAQWRSDTVSSVNTQLTAKGLSGVEASFDSTGNLQITAKDPAAKTLAVSGTDAAAIFGAATVDTGTDTVMALNATKPVDQFVEVINRDFAGKLRASNDNGKLRIENLSTADMTVRADKDGTGSFTSTAVAGNSVRESLSKQFNDLRDQLDKLSDDASFNGINLLRGDELTLTFNESGSSTIKIQNKDGSGNATATNAQNLDIATLVGQDLDTDTGIDTMLAKLSTSLNTLRSQASSFGSSLSSVQNRQDFTKNMINTLQTGAANLTLADTNEEAANLLALQTRQQLSSSALSMASQQDQAVLRLLQ